jgi:hypothetical protein
VEQALITEIEQPVLDPVADAERQAELVPLQGKSRRNRSIPMNQKVVRQQGQAFDTILEYLAFITALKNVVDLFAVLV